MLYPAELRDHLDSTHTKARPLRQVFLHEYRRKCRPCRASAILKGRRVAGVPTG